MERPKVNLVRTEVGKMLKKFIGIPYSIPTVNYGCSGIKEKKNFVANAR